MFVVAEHEPKVVGYLVQGVCPETGRQHVSPIILWTGGPDPGSIVSAGSLPASLEVRACGCDPARLVRDDRASERAAVESAPRSENMWPEPVMTEPE